MGGFGSGRTPYADRDTVEDTHSLHLQWLMRQAPHDLRLARWYSPRWTCGDRETGSMQVYIALSTTDLIYWVNGENVEQRIQHIITPCRYGGEQHWWACPYCGRRCLVLHMAGRRFRCRKCAGLRYQCQRELPHERSLRKAQRIRTRLGGSASMIEPFPVKPPRMRWHTYQRLQREYVEASERDIAGLLHKWSGWSDLG